MKNQCGHRFSEEEAVCQTQEEYPDKERNENCGESLVVDGTSMCTRMGSPAHLLTSSSAHRMTSPSSQRGIKAGLDEEIVNSLGTLPLKRILSLQPLSQQQQQQQKQTSPPLSSLEKEAFPSWYPVWMTSHWMGDRKHKVVRHLDF